MKETNSIEIKFFAAIQALIMILSMMFSLVIAFQTSSIALSINEYKNTRDNLKEIKKSNKDDLYVVYGENNDVIGNQIYRDEDNIIYINEGTTFYILPEKYSNSEFKVYGCDKEGKEELLADNNEEYKIEAINLTNFYQKDEDYKIDIYVTNNNENIIQTENMYIQKNKIVLSSENENISTERLECKNAVIENDTLYIAPNTQVKLSNMWNKEAGEFYIENENGIKVSGDTLTAEDRIGETAVLNWKNNKGATAKINVVTSNLSTTEFTKENRGYDISYGIIEDIFSYIKTDDGRIVTTDMNVGADTEGLTTTIRLKNRKAFENCNTQIVTGGVKVTDVTNCLDGEPTVTYGEDYYEINLKAKQEGGIKVSLYDYKNEEHEVYWKIVSNNVVSNETIIGRDYSQQLREQRPPQRKPYNPYPTISFASVREVEQHYELDFKIEDATEAMYGVSKEYLDLQKLNMSTDDFAKRTDFDFSLIANGGTGNKARVINPHKLLTIYGYGPRKNETLEPYHVYIMAWNDSGNTRCVDFPVNPSDYPRAEITSVKDENGGIKCEYNDDKSELNLFFTSINCTEIRYKWISSEEYDKNKSYYDSIGGHDDRYEDIGGTVITNIQGEIKIPLKYSETGKAGKYYLLIGCKNNLGGTQVKRYWDYTIYTPAPKIVDIVPISNESNEPNKNEEYQITVNPKNTTVKSVYAYITKENKEPTNQEIKNKGIPLNKIDQNNEKYDLKIGVDQFGAGEYNLYLYVENTEGKSSIYTHKQKVVLANAPRITYKIEGEPEYATSSISSTENKKYIDVTIEDIDENDEVEVGYLISDEKIESVNQDNLKKVENVKIGESFRIEIPATEGKKQGNYVYIIAKDKYGVTTIRETGEIVVNDEHLKLERIYANKEEKRDGKIYYNANEFFAVTFQFNKLLDIEDIDNLPNAYIDIGNNSRLMQEQVTAYKNEITYYFTITNETSNDIISRISLTKKFNFDFNQSDKLFENSIKCKINTMFNEFDISENNYYVKTIGANLKNVEINITVDPKNILEDNENDIIYVNNGDSVKVITEFEDIVSGDDKYIDIYKGGYSLSNELKERDNNNGVTRDTFECIDSLNGLVHLDRMGGKIIVAPSGMEIYDSYGNPVNFDGFTIKYVLNGEEITDKEIVYDDYVYPPQIYSGDKMVDYGCINYNIGKGSELKIFTEYCNNGASYDLSGIKTIDLVIAYNGEENKPEITDINGYRVAVTQDSDIIPGSQDKYMVLYNLNENQLPVTLNTDKVTSYEIKAQKKDKLGNKVIRELGINIIDSVKINKDRSKLNINDTTERKNIKELGDEEKEFTLNLELEGINTNEIKVFVRRNVDDFSRSTWAWVKADEAGIDNSSSIEDNTKVSVNYKFNIEDAGKFDIKIEDLNKNTLLEDSINVNDYKVYMIGDVNEDGLITAPDIIWILCEIGKIERYQTEMIEKTADIDGSGEIDVTDAVLLARYIAGDKNVGRTDMGILYEIEESN